MPVGYQESDIGTNNEQQEMYTNTTCWLIGTFLSQTLVHGSDFYLTRLLYVFGAKHHDEISLDYRQISFNTYKARRRCCAYLY